MALREEQKKAIAAAKERRRQGQQPQMEEQPLSLEQQQAMIRAMGRQVNQAALEQGIVDPPGQKMDPGSLLMETVAGINRSMFGLIDMFGPNPVNAALEAAGSSFRVPTTTESFGAPKGSFAGPGVATDIAASTGEFVPAAATMGGALRGAAAMLPQSTKMTPNIVKEMAKSTPRQDVTLGALAGGGAALGEAIGGGVGGDTGAAIGREVGAMALPVVGPQTFRSIVKTETALKAKALQQQGDAALAAAKETSSEEALKAATEAIKKAKPKEIIMQIEPDAAFYRAADDLGINVEPLASFASKNPQFRALEQSLASTPASQLDDQGKRFISQVAQKADDLIVQYGGTHDKAALSDRFRQDSIKAVDDLFDKETVLYDSLGKLIPKIERVNATETVGFIKQQIKEAGGIKEVSPRLRRIFNQLNTTTTTKPSGRISVATGAPLPGKTTTKQPTFGKLEQVRKEIGQALRAKSGPFKDEEVGLLKALYSRLRTDTDAVATAFDASDVTTAANALTVQRKQLESSLASILGKDLSGSVTAKAGTAIKALSKGNAKAWDDLMGGISSQPLRQEIAITAMQDAMMRQGTKLSPKQFTVFMEGLARNQAAKARLYRELPRSSIKAIEDLAILSKGISTAMDDRITTGRALFNNDMGFMRRMMGRGVGLAVSRVAPLPGAAVHEYFNQRTGAAKAAADLLSTDQFRSLVRRAVSEGVQNRRQMSVQMKKAEKLLMKSRRYKRWSEAVTKDEAAEADRVGFIAYLLAETQETQDGEGE